jgi:multiple sugar transport system substrate-binding protein
MNAWHAFGQLTTRRALLGAAGAGAVLAACGPVGGGPGARPASKAPVTIRLGERAGTEEQAFDARLPAFKEQFPHITVVREAITGDMIAALRTMAASNTLPDNAHTYTGGNEYHSFAVGGAFTNIDSYIARDKLDLKQWFPEMIDIMRIDGKLYGLPFKGQVLTGGFFYNVSLFEKRGIPVPNENWTLDDLVKAAQQLTMREGTDTVQWGYAVQTWGGENFNAHLRQWGGDTYSKDGKKATLDTPQVLEGLQWYEMMFTKERIMHPLADAANDFYQGKVAMIGRTYFNFKTAILTNVGGYQDGKFKWDGMMMPKHPKTGKRGGMFAGDAHSVTRESKAPDAAFELLKWITDKEFGVALALQTRGSTTPGGRPDVYADQRILNHPQYPKQTQVTQLNSVREIREPFSAPANFRAADVAAKRDPATTRITTGEAKAEAGYLKQLNSEIQAILDLPRP